MPPKFGDLIIDTAQGQVVVSRIVMVENRLFQALYVGPKGSEESADAKRFIGSFQLGCVLGLRIFGIEDSPALAFSLIVHLTQFVGVIGAGLYSLWVENISLREVEAAEQQNVRTD